MLNDIDQMTEEPEVIESNDMTVLGPIIFATASVQVLREEEAFTFGSLVADCGGVLGLFVGFNFLMVWDWLVLGWNKFLYDKLAFSAIRKNNNKL